MVWYSKVGVGNFDKGLDATIGDKNLDREDYENPGTSDRQVRHTFLF